MHPRLAIASLVLIAAGLLAQGRGQAPGRGSPSPAARGRGATPAPLRITAGTISSTGLPFTPGLTIWNIRGTNFTVQGSSGDLNYVPQPGHGKSVFQFPLAGLNPVGEEVPTIVKVTGYPACNPGKDRANSCGHLLFQIDALPAGTNLATYHGRARFTATGHIDTTVSRFESKATPCCDVTGRGTVEVSYVQSGPDLLPSVAFQFMP